MDGWGTRGQEEWMEGGSKQLRYGERIGGGNNKDVSGYGNGAQ